MSNRSDKIPVGAALILLTLIVVVYGVFFAWVRHPPLARGTILHGQGLTIGFREPREYTRIDQSKVTGVTVEFSFPMKSRAEGCERWYGAALVRYPGDKSLTPMPTLHRYLVRFKYDLPRERCLSDELVIVPSQDPFRIYFQQMLTTQSPLELTENSWGTPIEIKLPSKEIKSLSKLTKGEEFPFLPDSKTLRTNQFSFSKGDSKITPIISPYQSLKTSLLSKIEHAQVQCATQRICLPISMVVARIEDADIMASLQKAQEIGIPIFLIQNFTEAPRTLESYSKYLNSPIRASAWMWLQGNPYTNLAKLPMHLKFAIFGNDTVVSSNANYDFVAYSRSRELALEYQGKKPFEIFSEISAMTRSGFLYPVSANPNDDVQILFNATRARSFSPLRRITSVAVRTPDGLTSPYGMLYKLLDESPDSLNLMMSPLTSSCARFGKRRCLFPILSRFAREQRLELTLNGFFYLPYDFISALASAGDDLNWNLTYRTEAQLNDPLETILNEIPLSKENFHLKMDLNWIHSNHHERFGILGDQYVLAGSSNYATPSSYNTIEILRSPEIAKLLQAESRTVIEPYFITPRSDRSLAFRTYGSCEFIFEFDLLHGPRVTTGTFEVVDLRKELAARYGISEDAKLALVKPRDMATLYQNSKPPTSMSYDIEPLPMNGHVEDFSSYHCVKNADSAETYVARSYLGNSKLIAEEEAQPFSAP